MVTLKDRVIRGTYIFLYIAVLFVACAIIFQSGIIKFLPSFNLSEVSLKRIISIVADFCVVFGLAWVGMAYCLSRIFEILYNMAREELLESVRLCILSPFRLSKADITRAIRHGESVYVEDIDDGICCLITQGDTHQVGVVKRLADDSLDQFECEDVAEEIIAMTCEGIGAYDPKALKELSEHGFELQS